MKKNVLLFLIVFCCSGFVLNSYGQSIEEKAKIVEQTKVNTLLNFAEQKSNEYIANKEKAIKLAKEKGWIITKDIKGGNYMELQGVTDDGRPLYYITHNEAAAISTATNKVYTGGV